MSEPLLHKITGPVFLNEGDLAFLMKASNGRPVECEFGVGWVRLKGRSNPASGWAVPLLAQRRGLGGDPASGLVVYGATESI